MRKIVFKGIAKENDQPIVGFYVKCDGKHYILVDGSEDGFLKDYDKWTEIYPETIEEFSGFYGTHEKYKGEFLIFEGDKVRAFGEDYKHDIEQGDIGVVEFDGGAFSIRFRDDFVPPMYGFEKFVIVE